jgi:hypothetical protein
LVALKERETKPRGQKNSTSCQEAAGTQGYSQGLVGPREKDTRRENVHKGNIFSETGLPAQRSFLHSESSSETKENRGHHHETNR